MRRVRGQKNSGDVITGLKANFNRRKTRAIQNDHLIQCDVTGQVCLRSEARMTWRGTLVSNQNWDPKHPQLTINVPPDDVSINNARPFQGGDLASTIAPVGSVAITDQIIAYSSTVASYTLSILGQALSNSGGDITGEWWSDTPETGIGNRYQVMAVISQDQTASDGVISGIFGQWVSLSQATTWAMSSATSLGGVVIFVQIRDLDGIVQDTANITLGIVDASVDGVFYYKMGDPALGFRFSYASTTFGTLSVDISLSIGDTVTFSYVANNASVVNGDNFIESLDGVNFFGYASQGTSSFTGYTATLNGVAINSGDAIPDGNALNYPTGRARLSNIIVLTATVATDVHFIGATGIDQPIYDVTIVTAGQTWIFPIDTLTVTNPDSNGSGTNLILSANNFWLDAPIMFNEGTDQNNLAPYIMIDSTGFNQASNNLEYNVTSLRVDGTGGALETVASTRRYGSIVESIPIPYSGGFTIEATVKFLANVTSNGRACGVLTSSDNQNTNSLWLMGFDDYDGTATGSGTIAPQFTLAQRNTRYDRSADFSTNVADMRGIAVVTNNTYHLLATIRPSNFSIEFYVNGVSVGSVTLTESAFDAWANPSGIPGNTDDVLDGSFPTIFNVGTRFVNGAFRQTQNSQIQDFKVHLLEADAAFALQQSASANFTI